MKNVIESEDVISLTIHLNELKSELDKCILEDTLIERSRLLYMQIKETECRLHALHWHPFSENQSYATI